MSVPRHEPFPTTIWTLIRSAGAGRDAAIEEFVARYRPAVVRFARRKGLDEAEAEDVAQEVFLRIFGDEVLGRADRSRGHFRGLLLAVTRHVLGHHFERRRAQKRGGGKEPLSLDESGERSVGEVASPEEPDSDFDREWLAQLLSAALSRLAAENPEYHESLRASLMEGTSRREVASAQGKTEAMVRNAVSRGRAKLIRILREEIAAYAMSPHDFEQELKFVAGLLDAPRPTARETKNDATKEG